MRSELTAQQRGNNFSKLRNIVQTLKFLNTKAWEAQSLFFDVLLSEMAEFKIEIALRLQVYKMRMRG